MLMFSLSCQCFIFLGGGGGFHFLFREKKLFDTESFLDWLCFSVLIDPS